MGSEKENDNKIDLANEEGTAYEKKTKKDKKEQKKEKKQKKWMQQSSGDDDDFNVTAAERQKKRQRTPKTQNEEEDQSSVENKQSKDDQTAFGDEEEEKKKERKRQKREAEKKSKKELLDIMPIQDPKTGIGYTKLQIRRMIKRVKRGLLPVPTAQEEHERLKNEAALQREEEAELAGILLRKEDGTSSQYDSLAKGSCLESREEHEMTNDAPSSENAGNLMERSNSIPTTPKRVKPVPTNYICQACQNRNEPRHWIYDCPDKVTIRGTNQKKKKERGIHDPDSRKVFVSGLPFEAKSNNVIALFEQTCGKVVSCKLLMFQDTKRCNGQAIVTLTSDGAAAEALKLSGTEADTCIASQTKANGARGKDPQPKVKQLRLKVTKLLNRRKTAVS